MFDKAGNEVAADQVPADVARRLGLPRGDAQSWRNDDGPALVDGDGRPQTTRVFDAESKLSVDVATKQVFGLDGKVVDPTSLTPAQRTRLGFTAEGTFRDPRFVDAPNGRSVNPVTGAVIDTKTGQPVDVTTLSEADQAALRDLIDRHRVQFGGVLLSDDYKADANGKVPNVLVYGAGASGAWDVEQAIQGGATAEWVGRLTLPDPRSFPEGSPERADFTELRNTSTSPERRRELLVKYRETIVQETLKGGKNRRNSLPQVGAYSPEVQDGGRLDQSAKSIVDLQQTTDGRFYVRFSDGSDGVYDRAIMSIGQDSGGAGGVQQLTKDMRMQGLHGESGELVGAQDSDGGLRVIGAAGLGNPMMDRLGESEKRRGKRQESQLPSDSRNINVSIANSAYRIQEANLDQLGGDTAAEAAKRSELETAHEPQTADRLFRASRGGQRDVDPRRQERRPGQQRDREVGEGRARDVRERAGGAAAVDRAAVVGFGSGGADRSGRLEERAHARAGRAPGARARCVDVRPFNRRRDRDEGAVARAGGAGAAGRQARGGDPGAERDVRRRVGQRGQGGVEGGDADRHKARAPGRSGWAERRGQRTI